MQFRVLDRAGATSPSKAEAVMMDAFNDNQSGKPRSFALRPLYAFAALALIVVAGAIGWSTFTPHQQPSSEPPRSIRAFAPPPIVPPTMPPYRPAIVGAVDDATKACEAWKSDDATLSLAQQDAANAVAMCDA